MDWEAMEIINKSMEDELIIIIKQSLGFIIIMDE